MTRVKELPRGGNNGKNKVIKGGGLKKENEGKGK
jgi:hypothetical protein